MGVSNKGTVVYDTKGSAPQSGKATAHDKKVIKELAAKYFAIASLPAMDKIRRRMVENNGLKPGRPPVLLFELPWHELNAGGLLSLQCEDGFARSIEQRLRRAIYQWDNCPGDMYYEPVFTLQKSYMSTGNGMNVVEEQRIIDKSNNIYSHGYIDQLKDEKDLEKFVIPIVTAYPDMDAQNAETASELLDGVMKVELRGHDIYHAPWDQIARYRGVTQVMIDLYDRPGHLHAIMELFTRSAISEYEQMERLGLLECRNPYLHCTPALTADIPYNLVGNINDVRNGTGCAPRFRDVWFRSMAQMFADVSPSMHEEFDLEYGKRLGNLCALTYYGCCEPLQNKIQVVKKAFANLRKIGVTPWADEEKSAEQIGGDFVYSRKSNPAFVALKADPDVIRAETAKTVEICVKHGCPYEIVLKDISTVSYRPENLTFWYETVRDTLNHYYGEDN